VLSLLATDTRRRIEAWFRSCAMMVAWRCPCSADHGFDPWS